MKTQTPEPIIDSCRMGAFLANMFKKYLDIDDEELFKEFVDDYNKVCRAYVDYMTKIYNVLEHKNNQNENRKFVQKLARRMRKIIKIK